MILPADPWIAGLTRDEQQLHLAEAVRRITSGEHTPAPASWLEYEIDDTTQFRGGKSRSALKSERRQKPLRYDELGYADDGIWNPYRDGAA